MAQTALKFFRGVGVYLKSICLVGLLLVSYQLPASATNNNPNDHQKINSVTTPLNLEIAKQIDCLARNIYWEAADESYEGKVAVAQVTINRLESGRFGNTICSVVYQRSRVNQFIVCQFSWTCTSKSKMQPHNRKLFKDSHDIAILVYFDHVRLPDLSNALYFHNNTVRPRWRAVRVAQIGRHTFYRDHI